GAVPEGFDEVITAALSELPSTSEMPSPELRISTLGADVVVTGAIAAAVDVARAHTLNVWLARRERGN
ncbi:MAG: ROK family protein, partial [Ruaniaceae bacterium]|nr:ROK family protein [Ruaniaceae bacterium]